MVATTNKKALTPKGVRANTNLKGRRKVTRRYEGAMV
jgi:hypothetical protein